MKRVILFFALALSGLGAANAQWSDDPTENNQLLEKSYWSTEISMLDDGSFYMLGVSPLGDINKVTPILFYFDKDGNRVWKDSVVFEIDSTMSWIKTNTQLMVDNEGNAIVVAQDLCGVQIEKYTAWKVNTAGEHLWSEDGVNLHGETGMPDAEINAAMKMLQMPDGSYLFAWMGNGIMLQKVSNDGQLLWGQGKNIGSGAYPYVFNAGDGDIMVIYLSGGLEARRLDFDGNDVWSAPVPVFSGELNPQIPAWTYLKLLPTSEGVLVGYYGYEGDAHYSMISYIKYDGTHAFAEADQGLRVVYSDNWGYEPAMAFDEEQKVIYTICQENAPGTQFTSHFVVQKISENGELLWAPEGIELNRLIERAVGYQAVSIGPKGSVLFGYMEHGGAGISAGDPILLKTTLMDANGEFVWENPIVTIGTEESTKYDLQISPYLNDQWILFWEDCRVDGGVDGGQIFGQNVRLDGSMGTNVANEDLAQPSSGLFILPNPAKESAVINFTCNGNGSQKTNIDLIGMNGKVAATIYNGTAQPGENRIEWSRPSGLASGIYIMRLSVGQTTSFGKLVLQ